VAAPAATTEPSAPKVELTIPKVDLAAATASAHALRHHATKHKRLHHGHKHHVAGAAPTSDEPKSADGDDPLDGMQQ
jgi:hypothetical protein